MRCRAAILRGIGRDCEIKDIELDPPRTGEVLVKMAVSGSCHSDKSLVTGDLMPTAELVEAMHAAATSAASSNSRKE
jgi:Zn-dependent alcohol dehydrogenase